MIKLKDILNEVDPKKVFQKSVFTDPNDTHFLPRTKKLAALQNAEMEPNTSSESAIFDTLLGWIDTGFSGTDKVVVNKLYSKFQLFKDASKIYPAIFKPSKPNGTLVFRGISNPSDLLQNEIFYEIRPDKWTKYSAQGWYISSQSVYYKPRLKIQSWTYDFNVATEFVKEHSSRKVVLATKQDDNFLFSDKAIEIISGKGYQEKEVLHFGQYLSDDSVFPIVNQEAMDEILEYHKNRKPMPWER